MWCLVLLATAYLLVPRLVGSLTGQSLFDGIIGVVLGLYICSQPAANAIDVLFFERDFLRQVSSEWSGIGWVALNLLVVLVGWLVLVSGTTRLVG